MSLDVWIIRPPEGVEAVSDLTSGDVLSPFTRHEVHAEAQAAFERVVADRVGSTDTGTFAPVDMVDASFLRINGPDVYGELGLVEGDSQDLLTLNVRSGSERVTKVTLESAARLDARALDLQTGDWLTVEDGNASYAAWAGYRRRVISGSPSDGADGS